MERVASVRPAWTLSALLALAPAVGLSAESAQFNALGYSENGQYFAFEQFGVQDGSGFPYADIFIIDLANDSFVGGTPVTARIDEDSAPLAQARQQAHDQASDALAALEITRPVHPIVLRGDGALDDEGLSIRYGLPSFGLAGTTGDYQLNLELFKAPSGQDCEFFEGAPMGYALSLASEGETVEIHRDTRVPVSRGCVVTYKFYGVFMPFEAFGDSSSAVAVLSVWSHGFEGPDRRFLALPIGRH